MRIVVDFLPLVARGGGLQNARNLWRTILAEGQGHQWLAFARPDLGLEELGIAPHAQLTEIAATGTFGRLRLQNFRLIEGARAFDADVLFTPMGAGPFRGELPKVMGWHDSTVAYPEAPLNAALGLSGRLLEKLRSVAAAAAAQHAIRISVQTEAMADRLSRAWRLPRERFVLVPNGPSSFLKDEAASAAEAPEGVPIVLVVAEAKPAKNLEIVPEVVRLLRNRGREFRVVVTSERPGPGTWLGRAIARAGSPEIDFVGRVPHDQLGDLYRGASVVLLPSWVESFSATYLEAMHFGVPLVASDRDFARSICGDAALFADPADPADVAYQVERVLTEPGVRTELRERGFKRICDFPDWSGRLQLYLAALQTAAGLGPVAERVPQ